MINYEKLENHVFVTKLAGFEHTKYIQNNQTKTKTNESDVPLVQGKNIRDGIFVKKYDWFISKSISDSLIRSKLTKPCILIPYVGSNLGEVGVFTHPYDCHLASNIAKVELTDDYFDLYYLKYYLQSDIGQSYLFQSKQGSAQPNITMESIRKTLIIDKGKKEQQRIANVFKKIEDKIDVNNNIIQELENLTKTIYDYWFLQFEFPNQNGRPYKSSGGKMVWNNILKREVPNEWKIKFVDDYCNIFTGNKDVNQSKSSGKYKFYSCAPDYRYSDDLLYQGKAVLISGNGSYTGRTIYVEDAFDLYQRTYACVEKNDNNILIYIYYSLLKFFVPRVSGGTHGSAIPYIVFDDIAKQRILYNREIIEKFTNIVRPIQDKIIISIKENEELTSLKNFLLPLLMNGQVGFKD